MQKVALLVFLLFILWLLIKDSRRRVGVSKAVWMVVAWLIIIGSRPVSSWFSFGGGVGGAAEAYDSGNPFERQVYLVLIACGLFTIFRRGIQFSEFKQNNLWLVIFFLFWGVSVVWSDAPFVAFKRWFKDVGNLVMILVLLTEREPMQAIRAVFTRCACVLMPMSVMMIKFFGELGRAYHVSSGEMMFTGVTTHKNSLGSCVLVMLFFVVWDFMVRWREEHQSRDWVGLGSDTALLLMAAWLLVKAHSATAIGCMAAGTAIFVALSLPMIQKRIRNLELYFIGGGVLLWLSTSVFDVKRFIVVDLLGRDMTLTTRTEVWPMLIEESDGVLLGAGFNSFWSGERLAVIYDQLGIIQAHNGYLETYLNGGLVGVTLLLWLLFQGFKRLKHEVDSGSLYARLGMTILVVTIIYDFTEAAFNKMGPIWFAMLLVITRYPFGARETIVLDTEEFDESLENAKIA